MRPFRLAPALISLLVLNSSLASRALAQPAPKDPEAEEGADAEEAPMDDGEEAPPADGKKPAAGDKPAAPPPAATEGEEEMPADEEMPSDAEMDAEMDKELAAEEAAGAAALTKPPAKGKGAIVGVVKDAVEHETTPEAQITVVGTKYKTIADFDGRYRLELPPGTYTLRIYVELHKPSVIKGVEVKADVLDRFDIDVVPDESSVDTVEIVTEADKSSVEGLLLTRQRATAVGDGVGRAEISKTPASNAAQATQRVVGATIVGNRFVYVRGLGERYTNALLNGAPLPSPEPDRAAIPLDLFPSLILESITIVKTFTPDVPGDFAGGSVRIDTRELPTKPLFQLSLTGGYDTNSTFKERYSHPGSKTDWLGYDHSVRPLPKGFPSYGLQPGLQNPTKAASCENVPEACITQEDVLNAGRSANSSMHPRISTSGPNYGVTAVAGNGWKLPGDQRLGVLATINYGRSFKNRSIYRRDFMSVPDPVTGEDTIRNENEIYASQGEDKVNWGAFASASYWPSTAHRITLTALHTQLADSSTNYALGTYENLGGNATRTAQLRYISRALNMLQLRGEHDFKALNKATLTWNATYSVALRDEPDTRTTAYDFNPTRNDGIGSWSANTNGASGVHQFSNQSEKQKGGGLDWTQPLTTDPDLLKLKVGGLLSSRDRDFGARRFVYGTSRSTSASLLECGPTYYLECPDKLFQYGNIGTELGFKETTFPNDAYRASLDIYAGYAMVDTTPVKDLRIIAGARVERTDQAITAYSLYDGSDQGSGKINSTDVLPAVSLSYSATKKTKLRVAVSETLARPQIRELSPSNYADYFGGRQLSGNPQLQMTHIKNADLRLETFPTPREVLAFSLFYKLFDAPIEPYVTSNSIITFQNAKGARLVGLELEARKSLDFINKSLTDFSAIANLTLAHSQIDLEGMKAVGPAGNIVTNRDRAMVNQAPYVLNLALDYASDPLGLNVRLLGNVVGPRIVQVGTSGLQDEYEQPRFMLDFTAIKNFGKHIAVRLNAVNLINAPILVTLGKSRDADKVSYREVEGRIFSLTGTYTY